MLKRFLITDRAGGDFGVLAYDPAMRVWQIAINPQRTWDDTPLSLALYIKNGIFSLDERQSLNWVRDRLLPPSRQDIYAVLRELELPEYDEYALLQETGGRSANDNLFLLELEDQIGYASAGSGAIPCDSGVFAGSSGTRG